MPCTAQSSAGGAATRVADAPRGTSGKHVERGGPAGGRCPEAVVARGAEEEGAAADATTTGGGGAPVLCAMTLGRAGGTYGVACGVASVRGVAIGGAPGGKGGRASNRTCFPHSRDGPAGAHSPHHTHSKYQLTTSPVQLRLSGRERAYSASMGAMG